MRQSIIWRMGLTLVILVLSVAYLLPSFPAVQESPLSKVLPDAKINLGLDLMGGIYLALGVDVDKAVENSLSQMGQDIRQTSREDAVQITRPNVDRDRLVFTLPDSGKREAFEKLLAEKFPQLRYDTVSQPDGGIRYSARFTEEARIQRENMALDMALKTIRNRIDQFGVAEPDIRKQEAQRRIIIQLPGLKDTERAIQIIGKTAHLEFHIQRNLSATEMERADRGLLPSGTVKLPMMGCGTGTENGFIVVERDAVLTGEYIEDAYQTFDQHNRPCVGISLSRRGATLFERITGENVNRNMAIVLDGKVYSAPNITEKISQGRATITGSFSIEEANDLALVLRAGSLPAPVKIEEERTVGPSLGQDSIDKGINAALIGLCAVVLFIIVYYSLSGVIAAAMLFFDIVLLLAGMAAFGATLTLPGIAGIVLTIGMAVDANVLIFERIREELRVGATPAAAVKLGFSRAAITIMDSNLTTIIAAVILYQFGTGPVRGFAVTLTLGIIASMFTAIFVSRAIFDLWITPNSRKISI